jgi:hypothetical protein
MGESALANVLTPTLTAVVGLFVTCHTRYGAISIALIQSYVRENT